MRHVSVKWNPFSQHPQRCTHDFPFRCSHMPESRCDTHNSWACCCSHTTPHNRTRQIVMMPAVRTVRHRAVTAAATQAATTLHQVLQVPTPTLLGSLPQDHNIVPAATASKCFSAECVRSSHIPLSNLPKHNRSLGKAGSAFTSTTLPMHRHERKKTPLPL